jgi:hypothetical protein
VSLEQISKSPAFANQMQTDDETRMGIAQFFGDPQARTMVQQAGGIQPALKQIDNPMSFTPQRGLAPTGSVGDPNAIDHTGNAMARVSNQPAAPAVDFSQQNLNADIANLPVEEPTAPAAAAPPMRPRNADEYAQQNPSQVSVPGRPTVDFDNMSRGKKAMFLAFAGLGKFGDNLSGRNNSYLDQFMGNTMKQREAQTLYDQNLPAMKTKAAQDAYDRYLKNRGEQSNIAHTDAETADLQNGGGPRAMAKSAASRSLSEKLTSAWESGKYADPERFRAIAHANGSGIDPNEIDNMVDTITKSTSPGSKYDVWNEGGVPVGLKTKDGRMIPESQIDQNDPAAVAAMAAGKSGYKQSRDDKHSDAIAMGAARGAGQFTTIYHKGTGQTVRVSNGEAESLTKGPNAEYTSDGKLFESGRQKWSNVFDVDSANKNLSANLPKGPIDTKEIAQIDAAMHETSGPMTAAAKSLFIKSLSPEGAKAAGAMLAMRDQVTALIKAMGMDVSDTRAQSLYNAIPTAADLSNPYLVGTKMDRLGTMIDNVSQGLPGQAGNYGVGEGHGGRLHSGGDAPAIPQKAKKLVNGAYQYTVDGGKTWSTSKPK